MQHSTTKPIPQRSRLIFQCDRDLQAYLQGLGEAQRLDYLISIALTDAELCKRLLDGDEQSLSDLGFSLPACRWLAQLKVESLEELAREILASDWSPTVNRDE